MSKQQALNVIRVELCKLIGDWIDNQCENENEALDSLHILWGDETALHMANAAVSVIEAVSEAQEYMRQETGVNS